MLLGIFCKSILYLLLSYRGKLTPQLDSIIQISNHHHHYLFNALLHQRMRITDAIESHFMDRHRHDHDHHDDPT